ncbi:hypothetical protein FPT12_07565 [Pseudomonas sp. H3(2019)]|nr:hypothetical protein FPT12_07565 [Pseudomonas sp. H3(2019)]
MQLHEATQVREVYGVDQANELLQEDCWRLLAVTGVSDPQGGSRVVYVLGNSNLPRKPAAEQGSGGFQREVRS